MQKKTDTEMGRFALSKTARVLIRLKHSIAADYEINSRLPVSLREYDDALARGEVKSAAAALEEVLEG